MNCYLARRAVPDTYAFCSFCLPPDRVHTRASVGPRQRPRSLSMSIEFFGRHSQLQAKPGQIGRYRHIGLGAGWLAAGITEPADPAPAARQLWPADPPGDRAALGRLSRRATPLGNRKSGTPRVMRINVGP
jgi:hypothetical protein